MIFQDPLSSLNPVVPIGIQVTEVLERHRGMKRSAAMVEARDLLDSVGIPDPTRRLKEYPFQLSGGMRQRALIAMAVACRPRLLIADEPTTALDVTIQAQILAVLKDLVVEHGTALIMITHDLGVVAGLVDEVNVLYGGRVVERADRHELFASPRHPYTHGLLESIPRLDAPSGERLTPIHGSVADNIPWTNGCAFAPRCGREIDACREVSPVLVPLAEQRDHLLRCHNPVVPVAAGTAAGSVSRCRRNRHDGRPGTGIRSRPSPDELTAAAATAETLVAQAEQGARGHVSEPTAGCARRRAQCSHRRRRRPARGQRPQGAFPDQAGRADRQDHRLRLRRRRGQPGRAAR